MATIVRTKEASWRAVVRRKGKYACKTFRLKTRADEWALETERLIDLGGEPTTKPIKNPKTLAHLIDLHITDLQDVSKPLRRSKRAVMDALKRDIGATRIDRLDRAAVIKYGQIRAK